MSSEALTSSTEDREEEEWLRGCAAERKNERERNKKRNRKRRPAAVQRMQSHPARAAFHRTGHTGWKRIKLQTEKTRRGKQQHPLVTHENKAERKHDAEK